MTTESREIHESDWAIFCRVIDNHGDIGVCWRLASQLAARGLNAHIYTDDASALDWMAPQGCDGVRVHAWPAESQVFLPAQVPGVVIEAFGCELPLGYQAAMSARERAPVWINLEYFSLETSAQRNHGLPSPVLSGAAKGLCKWFYYPGWDAHSGGLLTDFKPSVSLANANVGQAISNDDTHALAPAPRPLQISLFCYEPVGLALWLAQLNQLACPVQLHVTAGRAHQAVRLAAQGLPPSRLSFVFLDYLSQSAYDDLLSCMDLNLVRGEDSLVRAMCAGKPFLWQIYPQQDGAHWPKLQAFLQQTQAPAVVVQAHLAWNADQPQALPILSPQHLRVWSDWASGLRDQLQQQTSLTQRLIGFVASKG